MDSRLKAQPVCTPEQSSPAAYSIISCGGGGGAVSQNCKLQRNAPHRKERCSGGKRKQPGSASHITTENHHCKCNCLNREVHPSNSLSASLEILWKPTGKQLSWYKSRAALVRKRNFWIHGNRNERNMQIEPYLYTHMLTMHTLICLSIIYKCPPVKLKADATQLKSHPLNCMNTLSLITSTLQHSAFI